MLRAAVERWRARRKRAAAAPGEGDLERLQALHAAVEEAWSAGDFDRLRRLATPAMAAWFAAEQARLARAGLRNIVAQIVPVAAVLCETRREGETEYATALLRWRALDYLVAAASPPDAPQVVGGDPRTPVEVEELWTFARCGAAEWRLAAIDQV